MYKPVNLMNLRRILANKNMMCINNSIKFAIIAPLLNYFIICKLYINKETIVKYLFKHIGKYSYKLELSLKNTDKTCITNKSIKLRRNGIYGEFKTHISNLK